ncbi:MAG TPA: 30S ribosomal protein S18 [Candidatus Paceibacterota bacterium]|nr:30S ribosomal protein S18 [Candidatus Pacearchaeota archaeon]HPZ74466.1 30S ribosomal protein S18 [Candidatus Pacearchaeota archaeon]HQD89005.1 30S ribosomal protein S18 [Candidatus Pacearchaeota archaeon]HRR39184.1 30S ribosomal protein S18 [Candidatus Paceibacterota bacterium]
MACYFCQRNINEIDWKNEQLLSRYISAGAKIKSRKKTGVCNAHQRKLKKAIKKAREMAILPYIK